MCHQTVGLVARELEAHGVATVVAGSALDIVQHCGVPRFLFTDFPLGNPCGKPFDRGMQRDIVRRALALLYDAEAPGAVERTPYRWSASEAWRDAYAAVTDRNREALMAAGDARRARQAAQRAAQERATGDG